MGEATVSRMVHRCDWCGDPVTPEVSSLALVKEVTILCSDCLDYAREGEAVVDIKLNPNRAARGG